MLYLSEEDVRDLLDMPAAVTAVEEAFRRLAEGGAVNVPRHRAAAAGIVLHTMSAAAEYLRLVGYKAYTTTRSSARFHVAVYDATSGEMRALIEADYLGRLRTGAASAVATESMARPEASVVGLFGSGRQARTQLDAVCTVRKIERVEVYSPQDEHRRRFAEEMSARCAVEVVPVHAPNEAAAEKDIVICATASRTPVFDGRVLADGTHLNVIGSNVLTKAEIDDTTLCRADVIVCDSIEQCRLEAGDFVAALEGGIIEWSGMRELADVVTGRETGRARPEDVTLFKSVGLAVEDVAVAAVLLERAEQADRGQPFPC